MRTQTTITKIENGTIVLPKSLRKLWKEAEVLINISEDMISIKRLSKPALTFKEMLDEFQQAARKTRLSRKEVKKAMLEIRKEWMNFLAN